MKRKLALLIVLALVFSSLTVFAGGETAYAAAKSSSKFKKVTSLKATVKGENSVKLSWKYKKNAKKKINGYAVYRDGKLIKRVSKKKSSYTDTGLQAGTNYKYTVKAYKTTKVKKWYNKTTKKWQKSKPKKKDRGKSKKVKAYKYGKAASVKAKTAGTAPQPQVTPLTQYWTPDSAAAKSLREYVQKVTDPADTKNFIPKKDRIAVFDMDGTLTCETYFTYYDTMMFIEYCLKDHPDKVSDELKKEAASIKPGYVAGEALARNFAKAYAGMTIEELYNYAVEFGQKKTDSFNNMRYIDGFYLPMVEVVKYLYDNDFTIYVVSGTERTTTRAIVANSPIAEYVTSNHVIGTEFEVKQKGHETTSSNMDYKYADGDELVFTGGFIQKNLNANKSIYIEREIGKRPVLAFGNSGSDTSMMNYALDSRNKYPAQAYMIVADDNVREWGTQDWAKKSADYAAMGYVPISMKNEFAKIYPDNITRAAKQYIEKVFESSQTDPQGAAADGEEYLDPEQNMEPEQNMDPELVMPELEVIDGADNAGDEAEPEEEAYEEAA